MEAAFGRWLWERTGLNVLEQHRLPADTMRDYRAIFRAGHEAARTQEHGLDDVLARGW